MQIRGSFPHSGAGRILSLQKKIQKSFERKQSRMDQNRMPLVEALQQFREEAPAYFRIPGHRFERGLDETLNGASLAAYDLSEAEGLDDLHHAEGVIAEAQKLAAETWKAKKNFFSCQRHNMRQRGDGAFVCEEGEKSLFRETCTNRC